MKTEAPERLLKLGGGRDFSLILPGIEHIWKTVFDSLAFTFVENSF